MRSPADDIAFAVRTRCLTKDVLVLAWQLHQSLTFPLNKQRRKIFRLVDLSQKQGGCLCQKDLPRLRTVCREEAPDACRC